jgi:hypothetical protein
MVVSDMPEEILYANLDDLLAKLKKLVERSEECRIKVNKDNVKLKVRTKRKLYTAVLISEKAGVPKEALADKAKELASSAGCKNIVEIQ